MNNSKFKIVLIGDTGTGKTSIISKFHRNIFKDITQSTIGADFSSIQYKTQNGNSISLELWDTAGQEKYRALINLYFRNASVILFVFDLASATTLQNIKQWYEIYEGEKNITFKTPPRLFLIGNKCDTEQKWEGVNDLVAKYIRNYGFTYYETSAKTGENINKLFEDIKNTLCDEYDIMVNNSNCIKYNTEQDSLVNLGFTDKNDGYYVKRGCCLYQ